MATYKCAARGPQTISQPSSSNATAAQVGSQELTPYSQALARLEPLQSILLGFAHRNHNQHHRAAWWRCFGMLRRNCAKLVENLIVAISAARKTAATAAKAKNKKRRRQELVSGKPITRMTENDAFGVQRSEPEMEFVASHATWLHDVLAPKCYLAFSQLAADNQFAPLGVVLLGILAQVEAACDCVAPRPADPLPSPFASKIVRTDERKLTSVEDPTIVAEDRNIVRAPASESMPTASKPQLASGENEASRREATRESGGKAISREDVERATENRKTGKATGKAKSSKGMQPVTMTDHAKADTPIRGEFSASSDKRQVPSARVNEGDESARPAKKMKTAPVTEESTRGESNGIDKNKKKKKKVKKGEEFDDLFKGLF